MCEFNLESVLGAKEGAVTGQNIPLLKRAGAIYESNMWHLHCHCPYERHCYFWFTGSIVDPIRGKQMKGSPAWKVHEKHVNEF